MITGVEGQMDDNERQTDWQDNSNPVHEAEGSLHIQEEVGKVMMELFFWERKSEGKGRSVQEASINQFLKEEFDVSQFRVLDA
jgi:hypothetical protein